MNLDKDSMAAIAALLSSLTALVAVFIGPIITARIQHRQMVAGMREKWIYDLRQILSDIIGTAETASSVLLQSREICEPLQEKYDSLVRLEGKAKMMLNPKKQSHKQLQSQLEEMVALVNDPSVKSAKKMPQMRTLSQAIIPTCQSVFKEAWDKAT